MQKLKKILSLAFIFGLMNPMSATRIAVAQELNFDGFMMDYSGTKKDKPKVEDTNKKKSQKAPAKPSEAQTKGGCADCNGSNDATPPSASKNNQQDLKKVTEKVTAPKGNGPSADHNEDFWKSDPYIASYSNSSKVEKLISHAMKNKRPRPTGYCYRFVKKSLVASKLVDKYPPGRSAKNAVRDLKAQGWVNLLEDPRYKDKIKTPDDAPKGAIVVYENDSPWHGDSQIKTDWGDKGEYVSDFTPKNKGSTYLESPRARQAAREKKPYRISGVMIKPQ